MNCFIDLDGVLTDFVKQMCRVHGEEDPYKEYSYLGQYDLAKIWQMSDTEFWHPANKVEFWEEMPLTREAEDIVSTVIQKFGLENTAILTAPSKNPNSVVGKLNWVEENFPELRESTIVAQCKDFLARENVLVDDRDSNIEDFRNAGGRGILLPRAWNSQYKDRHIPLHILERELSKIKVVKKRG